MNILISIIALFMIHPTTTVIDNEVVGSWNYSVEAPDMTYKGVLTIESEDGDYSGTMNSQGVEIELEEVEVEDNDVSFKMNVQGFACTVSASVDGDNLKGVVSVDGFEIPLVATRAE